MTGAAAVPSTCPLDCADACGALVLTDGQRRFVGLRGHPDHGHSRGTLCGKTALFGELVTGRERLLAPLVREGGELVPARWGQAVERIVQRVGPLPGERVLGLSYAGSMGQLAQYFPQRLIHALGGVLTDQGLCDNSATAGYECVYGRVVGARLEDAADADLVVLWGADVRRTVQHLQPVVQRLARAGVPVVAIDIWRSDTVRWVERLGGLGLVIRPGTDAMLALALVRMAYERGAVDRDFIDRECAGGDAFEHHARAGHGPDEAAAVCGLDLAELEACARLLFASRSPFVKTGVGFARRRVGAMSMRAVLSLMAVLGHAERVHYMSFATFELHTELLARPDLRPPARPPEEIHHVELGRELESGRFGAVFVWGHNPVVTCPDAGRVARGLAREDVFVVVHDPFLTETARLADVVLPATLFVEHADVYRSYGHRRLQYARAACDAPADASGERPRSNVDAFAALGRALGLPLEAFEVTEEGLCEQLLEASAERLGAEGRARLAAGEAFELEPRPGRGTPSGKIELESRTAAEAGQPALASYVPDDACGTAGRFWLIPAPSVHTHNSTYHQSPRHRARAGAARVFAHPADARELGIAAGAPATLFNERGAVTLELAPCDDLPRGCLRVDGLPRADQVPERIGLNALVSPALSDLGASNTLYSTRVDLRPATAPATKEGAWSSD